MRRAVFAELLLRLVMPRDRAAATAGDLSESAQSALGFCTTAVRIAFGCALHQMRAKPARIAGGVVVATVTAFGYFTAIAALYLVALVFQLRYFGHVSHAVVIVSDVLNVLTLLWVPFQVGRSITRRYAGEELAVWTAIASLNGLAHLFSRVHPSAWSLHWGSVTFSADFSGARMAAAWSGVLLLLLGVLFERRKWPQQGETLA